MRPEGARGPPGGCRPGRVSVRTPHESRRSAGSRRPRGRTRTAVRLRLEELDGLDGDAGDEGTGVSVVAKYAGDGTFAPGTSNTVTVNVSKENSTTAVNFVTFDSSGNPPINTANSIPYGGSYILQIAVSDSMGRQCAADELAGTKFPLTGRSATCGRCPPLSCCWRAGEGGVDAKRRPTLRWSAY